MKIKVNVIPTIIALGLGLLAGYGFYAANAEETQQWIMFGVLACEFSVYFICGFGIKYAERGNVNITVLSVIFVILAVIANVLFSVLTFSFAPFIIVNGILLLLYAGILYGLVRALN